MPKVKVQIAPGVCVKVATSKNKISPEIEKETLENDDEDEDKGIGQNPIAQKAKETPIEKYKKWVELLRI